MFHLINSPIKYSGSVTLDPKSYFLSANLTIDVSLSSAFDELLLIINKRFNIKSIDCSNLDSYIVKKTCDFPFIEEGNELRIKLINKTKKISFSIKYDLTTSKIGSWGVNQISFDYTELGLYTPWYPFVPNQLVTYNLEVLMRNKYQLTSLSNITFNKGRYTLKSNSLEKSILLFSARKIYSQKNLKGNTNINLFYFDKKHEEFANELSAYSRTIIDFFSSLLSSLKTGKDFNIFIANRSKGGAYARNNAVIMQYVEDHSNKKERLFKSLSHEIAHLWWGNAPTDTWEDWLNESFAEYFSLLALKEFFSKNSYEQILNKRKASFNSLPAIKGIARTDNLAHEVLYNKGSVILNTFSSQIGPSNFIKLCKNINKDKLGSTDQVIALVEDELGTHTKKMLVELLNK